MLISGVKEGDVGKHQIVGTEEDSDHYQTAHQLFELMAQNHEFNSDEDTSLTAGELILIYQNIELGTQLMTSASVSHVRRNQHVESVIYNEDTDSPSDLSEVASTEDIIFDINNERLDLITQPSYNHNLSHKYGDLQLETRNLTQEYNNHTLFNDPFIREQLHSLNMTENEFNKSVLPTSLLDYVCCKRIEDNCNFYMDNIINYVKKTIEQLQRISNGDYLTEKAKEKWKETCDVNSSALSIVNNNKIVTSLEITSNNISRKTVWDDIVHSEVDIRTLTKILQKKIVIELPRMVCSQFKFLTKYCSENVIINCDQADKAKEENTKREPNLDLVVHVKRSDPRHVTGNINSIMILESPNTGEFLEPVCEDSFLPCIEYNIHKTQVQTEIVSVNKGTIHDDNFNVESANNEDVSLYTNDVADNYNNDNEASDNIDFKTFDNNDNEPSDKKGKNLSDSQTSDILNKNEDNEIIDKQCQYYANESISDSSLIMLSRTCSNTENVSGGENNIYFENFNLDNICKNKIETIQVNENENKVNEPESFELLEEFQMALDGFVDDSQECKSDNEYNTSNSNDEDSNDFITTSETDRSNLTSDSSAFTKTTTPDVSRPPNMQTVQEEIEAEKESTKNRKISPNKRSSKSPYENKTFSIEEKRRRKLLEIREKREKKKIALQDLKILKHKKIKMSNNMPQASSSVTKLSISNKSFYNSIFGQSSSSSSSKKHNKNILESLQEGDFNEDDNNNSVLSGGVLKGSIDRSFYLDDTDTAVSYLDKNDDSDMMSVESSNTFNDSKYIRNLNSFIARSNVFKIPTSPTSLPGEDDDIPHTTNSLTKMACPNLSLFLSSQKETPKTPKTSPVTDEEVKVKPEVECKESIDKIYGLLKRLCYNNPSCENITKQDIDKKSKLNALIDKYNWKLNNHIPNSDSDPELNNEPISDINLISPKQNVNRATNVVINNKRTRATQKVSFEAIKNMDKNIKKPQTPSKRPIFDKPRENFQEDPLKALSNILQEIDNAQKNIKIKKTDIKTERRSVDTKSPSKDIRKPKIETKSYNQSPERNPSKEKHFVKASERSPNNPDKESASSKKKLIDIIDEVKEARGEAVKGPRSRLDTLALPRKSYVQAHSEEYQSKYGRNLMSVRLQRLAKGSKSSSRGSEKPSVLPPPPPPPLVQKIARKKEPPYQMNPGSVRATSPANAAERGFRSSRRVTKEINPKTRHNEPIDLATINDTIKKMEAVECYVKNHYGSVTELETKRKLPLRIGQSRIPIPLDVDNEAQSVRWSNEVNLKLRSKVNSAILAETSKGTNEGSNIPEESDQRTEIGKNELLKECGSVPSVFADNTIITAVAETSKSSNTYDTLSDQESELEVKNTTIYTQVSSGTFNQQLRLKKPTLTPKHSLKHLMFLQSGDSASMLLKHSSSINISLSPSKSDEIIHIKESPSFSLGFPFPMQISTIGFALTQYGCKRDRILTNDEQLIVKSVEASEKTTSIETYNSSKKNDNVKRILRQPQRDNESLMTEVECPGVSKLFKVEEVDEIAYVTSKVIDKRTVDTETTNFTAISKENYAQTDQATSANSLHALTKDIENTFQKIASNTDLANTNVNCTSSLDILVGLLNEIKNITCQTTITSAENNENSSLEQKEILFQKENKEDKSETPFVKDVNSLCKLEDSDTKTKIYSLYITSDQQDEDSRMTIPEPEDVRKEEMVNKEVSAHIIDKCSNRDFGMDTSSQLLNISQATNMSINNITQSTNMSNSLIGIISEPSSTSILLLHKGHTAMETLNRIINLNSDVDIIKVEPGAESNPSDGKEISNRESHETVDTDVLVSPCKTYESVIYMKKSKSICSLTNDYNIKLKRDILVTVYSLLVITVFAALSFPEVVQFT